MGWSQVPLASLDPTLDHSILGLGPLGLWARRDERGKGGGAPRWIEHLLCASHHAGYFISISSFQTYKGGIIVVIALDEETAANRWEGGCPNYTVRKGGAGI